MAAGTGVIVLRWAGLGTSGRIALDRGKIESGIGRCALQPLLEDQLLAPESRTAAMRDREVRELPGNRAAGAEQSLNIVRREDEVAAERELGLH